MRTFISFLVGMMTAAVVVGLGVLVAQNGQTASFTVLGVPVHTQMGWLVAGAVALGFVLAALLLIPGQMARTWRGWWLGRQMATLISGCSKNTTRFWRTCSRRQVLRWERLERQPLGLPGATACLA